MKATYGVDFFGCWRVMLGPECIGEFATKRDAKAFCEKYNQEHEDEHSFIGKYNDTCEVVG